MPLQIQLPRGFKSIKYKFDRQMLTQVLFIRMDRDQGSVRIPNTSLNVDIIMEILSWLPVLALLRLKLVCKEWKNVIEGETFKLKHYERSIACVCRLRQLEHKHPGVEKMIRDVYQCLGIYYGMIVETSVFRQNYRIRNPALRLVERSVYRQNYRIRNPALRLVIELPNPHEGTFGIFLSHLPSPGDFKLISPYNDGKEAGNGCEILCLDGSVNPSWRKLKRFPNLSQVGSKPLKTRFVSIGMVVHCILLVSVSPTMCMHILSVDIEKEDFLGIMNPNFCFPDIFCVEPFLYNGELGFAQIVTTGIQVYTLANCNDFVKKVVLPLTFFTTSPQMTSELMLCSVHGSEIWFNWGAKQLFVYDTVLGRITRKKNRQKIKMYRGKLCGQLKTYAFPLKPSLFAIKGMGPTQMTTPNRYMELIRV